MAELRKMGVRLTAEGVNQYKEDLRSAGREARLMSQETRLSMAELGDSASYTEQLTTRMKGLSKQYEVDQNRVKMLTKSQKEFRTSLDFVGREIKSTSAQLKDSQRETNRLENNYRKMGQALGYNAEETKKAKAEWEASKAETKELAQSLNQLEKEQTQYTRELDQMPGKINSAKISMQEKANEIARLREEYIKSGGELGRYADQIQETSQKIRTFSEGLKQTGDWMTTRITAPTIAMGTAMMVAGRQTEEAYANIAKETGKTGKELDGLRSSFRNVFKTVPDDAMAVSNAISNLSITTNATGKELEDLTRKTLDYANVNKVDAAESAKVLGKLMNGLEIDVSKLPSVMDKLTYASQQSGIGVNQLAEYIIDAGPAFEEMGFDLDRSIALFSQFEQVGANPKEVLSSLNIVLTRLAREGATDAKGAFEMLLKEIKEAPDILTATDIAAEAFGARVGGKIADDIRAGHFEIDEWVDALQTAEGTINKTAREAETFGDKLNTFKNKAILAFEPFGKEIVDALGDSTDAFEPLLEGVANLATSFSELDTETQQSIIKFVALGTAAGPVISTLGRVGEGVSNAGDGFAWLVRKIGGLRAETKLANPEITGTGTEIAELGSIAMTAGGTKGIGGFAAALGGSLPILAGVTLAVGVGYGAWKLWGEGIYESAKRTKKWGTDVGETTDEALTDIQTFSQKSAGQFNLMAQGFDTDTKEMMGNFEEMGSTIENSLVNRISTLDKLIAELPDNLQGSLGKIFEEDKKQLEKNLERVQEHNNQILEIKENALKQGRDITVAEANIIQSLNEASAKDYIKTLGLTKEEQSEILTAITGDVENATKKQSRQWLETLGEQRNDLIKDRNERRKIFQDDLEESGMYSEARIKELVGMWDEMEQSTTDGMDAQIAALVKKYPELANEIDLATGKVVSGTEEIRSAQLASNKEILDSAQKTSREIAQTSRENAEQLGWVADQATAAGRVWNEIVLDPKTGEVKTNAREEVIEAAASKGDWNQMLWLVKHADLDSNALHVIGEAALANGHWDSLDWEEKEAIIQDEFTATVIKGLEETGRWNDLALEEQSLLLTSDTPEKVNEALFELGLWDLFKPQLKELEADNYNLINILSTSEEALQLYEKISPEDKELLADNYDLIATIISSEEEFNKWDALKIEEKQIEAEYSSNVETIIPGVKDWNKTMNITPGKTSSEAHMKTNASTPTEQTRRWIDAQNETYSTSTKATMGTNAQGPTRDVNMWTDAQNKTKSTSTRANTSAPGITNNTGNVRRWTGEVNKAPKKKTSVFTTVRETINKIFNRRTGDQNFPGGDVWLGDGRKREPYLTPDGRFGVSGDDWELHNLPRGTRIWPTKQAFRTSARYNDGLKQYLDQIPKFAKGGNIQNAYEGYTGLVGEAGPEIFQIAQGKVSITPITQGQRTEVLEGQRGVDMSQTNELLQTLIQLVAKGQTIQMDSVEVGETIYPTIDSIMNSNLSRNKIMSLKGSD